RAVWNGTEEILYHPRVRLGRASLRFEALQVETGERWPVEPQGLQSGGAWRLRFRAPVALGEWVRLPVMLVVSDSAGREIDRTHFQTASLLDALYKFDGCLGVCFERGHPTLRVWAPTARSVKVLWK